MKWMPQVLTLALVTIGTGCTNLERSRDLANPDVPAAVTAVQVCSNCHGVDGNSVSPNFPRLAAQQPTYFIAQMEDYRSQKRTNPAGLEYMWGISHHLTDDQIKGLADYFSRQIAKQPGAPVHLQEMAAGKEIYEGGVPAKGIPSCQSCHGPKAEGAANAPGLAWQHQDYLMKQLHVFQGTEGRPGSPMQQIAHLLSEQEIKELAAYLQAFPKNN